MKVAVLYSGGKDSNYALYLAQKNGHEISCLISMKSKNQESYMFQTPGNEFVKYQAQCLEIPLIHFETNGLKEIEVEDMKNAIIKAKNEFQIEGVVSGAIKSAYQAQRVERVCDELEIECFNPLWQINEEEFMKELIREGFEIKIIGVFSYPLTSKYLGKIINLELLDTFLKYNKEYGLSPAGEGGELESFVVNGPNFKKKINIEGKPIMESENAGIYQIEKIEVMKK